MLNNQPQAGKEIHRLDFFRPDQIIFLVTHKPFSKEQAPDVELAIWIEKLSAMIKEDPDLAQKRASDFVAGFCDQTNDYEHLPEEILDDWSRNLQQELGRRQWRLVNPPRSYSFPPVNQDEVANVPSEYQQELFPDDAFSIIACDVEEIKSNDSSSSNSKKTHKEKEELGKINQKRIVAKQNLLTLIIEDLDTLDSRKNLDTKDLTVQAATPNWISSGGKSDSGGTGGPGGKPRPYNNTDIAAQIPYYFQDLIDKLSNKGVYFSEKGINLYGNGDGVDVVILDTVPPEDDLVSAYKELVERKDPDYEHPLVKSLWEKNGLLNIEYATSNERRRMGNTSLNKHGYKMTDHGLFIAGIINSIVPNATIHLIEVLNKFGVGDIETISHGFARAQDIYNRNKRPLVVNCSLCLDLPDRWEEFAYSETDEEEIAPTEKEFERMLRERMNQEIEQLKEQLEEQNQETDEHSLRNALRWVIELRVICERFGRIGRQVVAAAGNDSKKNKDGRHSPKARYPAAFTKVLGVGALPQGDPSRNRHEASSFSNLADDPVFNGIMTLGGEPGAKKGVLGLYLGEFPEVSQPTGQEEDDDNENQPTQPAVDQLDHKLGWSQVPSNNKNGWAWWAGTSFATPILTAAIASVLSGPQSPNTTQAALKLLDDAKVILERVTPQHEDGIPSSVRQTANSSLQNSEV